MSIEIEYQKRIVCFLDILGFAKIIQESVHTNPEIKAKALQKLNVIYNTYKQFAMFGEDAEITQFSDSIVVSIPYNAIDGAFFFVSRLQHLLIDLAANNILCRGGIIEGELYHNQSTVCGPALVNAYLLESKVANYPRVIVGPNIIKIAKTFKGPQNSDKHIEEHFSKLLSYDSDGYYYIEYLKVLPELDYPEQYPLYLDTIHTMVEEGLGSKDITIRAKYTWLGLKYNELISKEGTSYGLPFANIEHLIMQFVNDKYK